jgi:hypothetical protein
MECTRCHQIKELPKGKRWCKDCKNEYEKERKSKLSDEKKEELRLRTIKQYQEKKNKVQDAPIQIDMLETKICTVCQESKTLDQFHIAKCKGSIRAMCKECSSIKRKEYYKHNKEAVVAQTTSYKNEKIKTDPLFKLERRLRTRIYQAFTHQNENKTERTWKYIGCSPTFFQEWIQFQFYDGMTFDNYGFHSWHIDHVIPLSHFDLENEEQQLIAFNWRNTMPLSATDNLKKGMKIIKSQVEQHYKKLVEYHIENKLDLPQVYINLFAKHLVAGSPLEPI